jgi:hypothetical protein
MPGPSIDEGQGDVEYLVEICDPSEASEFGYSVNDVRVSDFYTPHFFDPVAAPGTRYSFNGAITAPRQVLRGGYLTWREPTSGHWFQQRFFGDRPEIIDVGRMTPAEGTFRSQIDRKTPQARKFLRRRPDGGTYGALRAVARSSVKSVEAKASAWQRQIAALAKKAV